MTTTRIRCNCSVSLDMLSLLLTIVWCLVITIVQSQEFPPILTQFRYQEAIEGTSVELECMVVNKSDHNLFWYFAPDSGADGHLIGAGEFASSYRRSRFSIVTNERIGQYNLKISKVQLSDAGFYTCTLGNSDIQPVEGRLNILRPVAPTEGPMCNLNRLNFTEGEPINGSCEVFQDGVTASTLQWFDGRQISVTPKKESRSDLMRKAHARDDGVRYLCRETHRALSEPRDCITGTLQVRHKPTVVFYPADKSAKIGSTATLTCRTKGNPVVEDARLYINDTHITIDSASSVDSRFSLAIVDNEKGKDLIFTIDKLEEQDYTLNIFCQAWNEIGDKNQTTWFKEPKEYGDGNAKLIFIIAVDIAALFGLIIIVNCILASKPMCTNFCYRCRRACRSWKDNF